MECCRICLGISDLTNIFDTEDTADNIQLFGSVQIKENDGLPQYICRTCKIELGICVHFKEKCEASYELLKSHNGSDDIKQNIILHDKNITIVDDKVDSIQERPDDHMDTDENHKSTISKYSCLLCVLNFANEDELTSHMHDHHQTTKEQCQVCLTIFPNYDFFADHLEKCHDIIADDPVSQCVSCNQFYFEDSHKCELWKECIDLSHATSKFSCKKCGESFNTYRRFAIHSRSHKNNTNEKSIDAERGLKRRRPYRDHKKLDAKIVYGCSQCDHIFTRNLDLCNHMKTVHGNKNKVTNNTDILNCDSCGFECSCHENVDANVNGHSSFDEELKEHKSIHTEEMPMECQYCGQELSESNIWKLGFFGMQVNACSGCVASSAEIRNLKRCLLYSII